MDLTSSMIKEARTYRFPISPPQGDKQVSLPSVLFRTGRKTASMNGAGSEEAMQQGFSFRPLPVTRTVSAKIEFSYIQSHELAQPQAAYQGIQRNLHRLMVSAEELDVLHANDIP